MARDIRRAIFVTTILVALSAFIFIGCWVLTFVPIVQVAAIVFLPFAQMFLAGAGFVDPVLERRKLSVPRNLSLHLGAPLANGRQRLWLHLAAAISDRRLVPGPWLRRRCRHSRRRPRRTAR